MKLTGTLTDDVIKVSKIMIDSATFNGIDKVPGYLQDEVQQVIDHAEEYLN